MYAVIGIWKANNVKILINRTDINDKWIFKKKICQMTTQHLILLYLIVNNWSWKF